MPPLTKAVVPAREDCLRLMRERQMLENVFEHSLRVAEVAALLSRHLSAAGMPLDLPLIQAASLLHDIAKIDSLKTRADHAQAGQEVVASLGLAPALGEIIRHHVRLPEGACSAECQVVNYSDKRVNGAIIVSLTERFDYIRGRYGRTADIVARITELEGRTRALEERLFTRLPFRPEELADHLEAFLLEGL
jgi:putative nucleotidyltransferase with HDIG domain